MDTIDAAAKTAVLNIPTARLSTVVTAAPSLPNGWVDRISILFPPGSVAKHGVAVKYGGNTILPFGQEGSFILGNAERLTFDVGMYMPGPISVTTQNADTFVHTVYLTFYWHTYVPQSLVALPTNTVVAT